MLKKIFSVIKIIRPLNVTSSGIAILFSSQIAGYQGPTSNVLLAIFVVIFFTIGANVLNDFFDYEAKYMGKSQEITPARISDAEKELVERQAMKVYQILNMKGFSRSEFIIVDGVPYFLEINTVPGMTEESLLPQQAKEASISLSDLFDYAIQQALK